MTVSVPPGTDTVIDLPNTEPTTVGPGTHTVTTGR